MPIEERRRGCLPHNAVGAAIFIALVVIGALVASPAAAERDPNDIDGPFDIRSVIGQKDGADQPLTITVRTWDPWARRLLRPTGPHRMLILFDVDADDARDLTARIVRSGGHLVAVIENSDGSASTVPASRPDRSSVRFTVPSGTDANQTGNVGIAAKTRSSAGADCDPACRDRSPEDGFDVVVPDTPSPPPGGGFECTEVVGFSQTAQWALSVPDFQDAVGNSAWQVRWRSGGAIYFWADPQYEGWVGGAESQCSGDADAPDRLVLTITSQAYEDDPSSFVTWIQGAIAATRDRYPSVDQVVLQPVVGGPGNGPCFHEGAEVRASHNHPLIDAAIAQVVGGDVVAGPSPEVRTCDDYRDSAGHLTSDARGPIGLAIADAYV